MLTALTPVTTVLRFLIPIIAVMIVLEIIYILLKNRRKPEPMAFFRQKDSTNEVEILFYENAIGRSKVNDIILVDPAASRFHAVLSLRENGWIITDTQSKAGVYVNESKVEHRAPVRQGDRVRMGGTTLIFLERTSRNAARKG